MYTTTQLSAAFAVDENTLKGWVRLGRLGRRENGRRILDPTEAFAIGLLAGLLQAQVPIGYSTIESAKIVAASRDRPPTITVRGSEFASVTIDLTAATSTIQRKLGALA